MPTGDINRSRGACCVGGYAGSICGFDMRGWRDRRRYCGGRRCRRRCRRAELCGSHRPVGRLGRRLRTCVLCVLSCTRAGRVCRREFGCENAGDVRADFARRCSRQAPCRIIRSGYGGPLSKFSRLGLRGRLTDRRAAHGAAHAPPVLGPAALQSANTGLYPTYRDACGVRGVVICKILDRT